MKLSQETLRCSRPRLLATQVIDYVVNDHGRVVAMAWRALKIKRTGALSQEEHAADVDKRMSFMSTSVDLVDFE